MRQQQVGGRARRMVAVTMLGIGLATAAASCTSSGATTANGPATSASTAESEATTSTASAGTDQPSSGPSTTKDPNQLTPASIVVDAEPGQEGYCRSIATAMEDLNEAALSAIGDVDESFADKALEEVKDLYRQLAEDAPDEIQDEVQTLSDAIDDLDSAAELQQLNDDPDVLAAGEAFSSWIASSCGFDPSNPSG